MKGNLKEATYNQIRVYQIFSKKEKKRKQKKNGEMKLR